MEVVAEAAAKRYAARHGGDRSAAEDGVLAVVMAALGAFEQSNRKMYRVAFREQGIEVEALGAFAMLGFRLNEWLADPNWPRVELSSGDCRLRALVGRELPHLACTRGRILATARKYQLAGAVDSSGRYAPLDRAPSLVACALDGGLRVAERLAVDYPTASGERPNLKRSLSRGKKIVRDLNRPRAPTLRTVLNSPEVLLWNHFRAEGELQDDHGVRKSARGRPPDGVPYMFLLGLADHFEANGFGEVTPRDAELVANYWGYETPEGASDRWQGRVPDLLRERRRLQDAFARLVAEDGGPAV